MGKTEKDKMPWAAKDFVMAEEQIQVKAATDRPLISEVAVGSEELKSLIDPKTRNVQITGTDFEVNFDSQTGSIYNLTYGGEKVITDGNGPKLDALRAFTNNDNWFYQPWFEHGSRKVTEKWMREKKIIRNLFVGGGILLVPAGVLQFAARKIPGFGQWYAVTIYPWIVGIYGRICGLVPFSVVEMGLYGLVLFFVYHLYQGRGFFP